MPVGGGNESGGTAGASTALDNLASVDVNQNLTSTTDNWKVGAAADNSWIKFNGSTGRVTLGTGLNVAIFDPSLATATAGYVFTLGNGDGDGSWALPAGCSSVAGNVDTLTGDVISIRDSAAAQIATLQQTYANYSGGNMSGLVGDNDIPTGFFGVVGEDTATAATKQLLISSGSILNTSANTTGDTEIYTGFIADAGSTGSTTGQLYQATGDHYGTGNTGAITLLTGSATAGNSGSITLEPGTASGTRGIIDLKAAQVRFTDNGDVSYRNTYTDTYWGTHQGLFLKTGVVDAPLALASESATAAGDSTNSVRMYSGSNAVANSTGNTGTVEFYTGGIADAGGSGDTGTIYFYPGDNAGTGASGGVEMVGGYSTGGSTGNFRFETGGADGAGNSGNITLKTGASVSGTRGYIKFDALVAVMPTGTASPATTYPNGSCYYNTSDNKIYVLNGGTWRATAALT
jgi:hypothetical protein